MVFRFLTDPIGWIIEQHTWFLDGGVMLYANVAFWPVVLGGFYAYCRYMDHRTMRRSMKKVAERERKKLLASA